MVESLINPHVLGRLGDLGSEFQGASPFRHVVIDDFLRPDVAEAILDRFPTVTDPSKLLNEFGDPNPKSAISDVRNLGGPFVQIDDYIQSQEFLDAMSAVTGIPDLRYDPWYYGAGTHENFHGAGLDAHYDFNIHPHTAHHRRLNAIVYLNKDWNPDWRGDISFHTDPWDLKNDVKKSVQPEFNRCVIFETTENSWHSVTPVSLPEDLRHNSRKSFTIYLYTESRPHQETAPEHGTVYVHPPLPGHIREGHTLTAQDMEEIDLNIVRRHHYLRQMYKREYKFARVIDDLKSQKTEWQRSSYVPVLGRGLVRGVSSPLYPDGWMGSELGFTLEARQDVSSFTANVWRPDDCGDALEITFQVGQHTATASASAGMTNIHLACFVPSGSKIDVSLASSAVRPAGGSDARMLSVILDSIEVHEPAQEVRQALQGPARKGRFLGLRR